MIHQYSISAWRRVVSRCSVRFWLSRLLPTGGGQEQVTCRKAAIEAVLMHDESDVPDFLQGLSGRVYPILIPLT
jgi:hypothetical protein